MVTRYGLGPYGVGEYGRSREPVVTPNVPAGPATPVGQARHIVSVGSAMTATGWRGAPNLGIAAGYYPPTQPRVPLTTPQSMSLTLRLDGGHEARVDLDTDTHSCVVIEDMGTDLWWWRHEPKTGVTEALARLNANNVDMRSTSEGMAMSATFVDYETLLSERLVLPAGTGTVPAANTWVTGTAVATILAFAIPTNTGINLAELATASLGNTNAAFEIPWGTPVGEVLRNLQTVSVTSWEWWIDTGLDPKWMLPKLKLTSGQRGTDRGIVLFHGGTGPSPIADWQLQTTGDRYANTVYFTGATTGAVWNMPGEIAIYGQRDATDADASVAANAALIDAAAKRRLSELASREPSWVLTLHPGVWEGRAHIDVGDTVSVFIALGDDIITGSHRVTEIQIDVDAEGNETVRLTLGAARPSAETRSRQSPLARLVRRLKNYERKL